MIIHHGGHGSCMTSLQYAIPSLVIPTHTERLYNAIMVEKLGFGNYIVPCRNKMTEMRDLFQEILTNSQYYYNLKKIESKIGKFSGVEKAVNVIEKLI